MRQVFRHRDTLITLAAAAVCIRLGFSAGGFFAGTTAKAAVVALGLLVIWVTLAHSPFGALSRALAAATVALASFALWVLVSAAWSDAPARALLEFDRALLYAVAVLVTGLACAGAVERRALLRGFALGTFVVSAAGLITRVLPDVWPIEANIQNDRLSYPTTYWNAQGIFATFGLLTSLHLTSSLRENVIVRVLAAAAIPILATTLFFTFSRGAVAVAPVGLVVYVVLARERGLVAAALATVVPTLAALLVAYGADTLATDAPVNAQAIDEGRDVALAVGLAALVAAALRLVLVRLDDRLVRVRLPAVQRRHAVAAGVVLTLVVLVPTAAAGGAGWVQDQYERFTEGNYVSSVGDRRERLVEVGNNGRIDHWNAALAAFRADPLHGEGAGTYAITWLRERPYNFTVIDGHSLYMEVLGELGLVGIALLAAAILALLFGTVRAARGPERAAGAAATALLVTWAIHAGIDWDWEMPVVTLPILALAAAFAASRERPLTPRVADPPNLARIVIGLACLVIALTPILVAISQSRLDAASAAFSAGDCSRAVDRALASNEVMPVRPQPLEILGYCDIRIGRIDLALRAFEQAISRDPNSWRLYYGLALARAAGRQDPRAAMRRAYRLNPRSELTRDLLERFATNDPQTWRRRAPGARLPY